MAPMHAAEAGSGRDDAAVERLVAECVRRRADLAGQPAWLRRRKELALARFRRLGFPTSRDEEWRFTSVEGIARTAFAPAPRVAASAAASAIDAFGFRSDAAAELVFVDGRFMPELSSSDAPAGVHVGTLAAPDVQDRAELLLARRAPFRIDPFTALNTAFVEDGAYVEIAADTTVTAPIHVLFLSTGGEPADGALSMSHPRVLAVAGPRSRASIVESYVGQDRPYFTNAVSEVVAAQDAALRHVKVQLEHAASHHVGTTHLTAERGATVVSDSVALGGGLVRNNLAAVLSGPGAACTLNGLYLSDGDRLVDNHTTVDHAQPHCGSRESYAGILAGRSRAVFNGRIIVRRDAQQTDAKQMNRALILSPGARINTQPQLEIRADDVKCTHGAAIGQLDPEAIFYLRSRGQSEACARRLLIRAFASRALANLGFEPLQSAVERAVGEHLARLVPDVERRA